MNVAEIQAEMMKRRLELIALQRKIGGTAAIDLGSDGDLQFCYNPKRNRTASNPTGECFYITGTFRGCPVILHESEVLAMDSEG